VPCALALAAAVRRETARLADGIGKALAQERATWRAINDALIARIAVLENRPAPVDLTQARGAAPDNNAAVLDLSDERRRRSDARAPARPRAFDGRSLA
jgi:hypothetical protein